MGVPAMKVLGSVQLHVSPVHQAAAAPEAAAAVQVVFLEEGEYVLFVDLDHSHLHGAEVNRAEGEEQLFLVREDVAADEQLHGRLGLFGRKVSLEILSQGMAVGILEVLVQGEGEVSLLAFEVHFEKLAFHFHIASGDALQFYKALHAGVHRGLGETHFHQVLLQDCLCYPECLAVVRLFFRRRLFGLASYGQAEGEGRGGFRQHLVQREAYGIRFPGLQAFGGEGNGGGGGPLCGTLHRGLDAEQPFGGLLHGFLRQVYADDGIIGHDASGIGLHIFGKFLGRWRLNRRFPGPAGYCEQGENDPCYAAGI